MHTIPLFDLKRHHIPFEKKILSVWKDILETNQFTSGKATEDFQAAYAKFCQTKHALGVHSGTDSLIISLKALELNQTDEVITTPCTFSASADSIIHAGAKPVFVDVDPRTGNINPDLIEEKITSQTKAILLVHLYGVPCEMDAIIKIAQKYHLKIIEDASHAHGSTYKTIPVGSFGTAGCFSLYPSKSLGALGNAGIITTNSATFLKKCQMYANHGIKTMENKYTHHLNGFNKLIDNMQAGALLIKMPSLKKVIATKQALAHHYNQSFAKIGKTGMFWPDYTSPSIYVYSFQTKKRDIVSAHFAKHGISTGVYYPIPLHLQPSMKKLGYKKGDFPHAEKFFNQTLSIPIFPELTDQEVATIRTAIETLNPIWI